RPVAPPAGPRRVADGADPLALRAPWGRRAGRTGRRAPKLAVGPRHRAAAGPDHLSRRGAVRRHRLPAVHPDADRHAVRVLELRQAHGGGAAQGAVPPPREGGRRRRCLTGRRAGHPPRYQSPRHQPSRNETWASRASTSGSAGRTRGSQTPARPSEDHTMTSKVLLAGAALVFGFAIPSAVAPPAAQAQAAAAAFTVVETGQRFNSLQAAVSAIDDRSEEH